MATRAEARAEYDAYLAECPARHLLDRISNKWVSLIVNALAEGRSATPSCPGGW